MDHRFSRELHFTGPIRHKPVADDSGAASWFWTPRRRGRRRSKACITTWPGRFWRNLSCRWSLIHAARVWNLPPKQTPQDRPESPFAVLKGLK